MNRIYLAVLSALLLNIASNVMAQAPAKSRVLAAKASSRGTAAAPENSPPEAARPSLTTARTQYVERNGIRFAYRRFGRTEGTPLVFIQHFRGNLDNYDPAITDPLAEDREVIVFDNAGVGGSTGAPKNTIEAMARDAEAFVDALGLQHIDLLAHSMGGYVAQQMAVDRPELLRKIVLVGTGPRSGEGMAVRTEYTASLFVKKYEPQDLMWGPIFFTSSEAGQVAARQYFERTHLRTADRDAPVVPEAAAAHGIAARTWGAAGGSQDYLKQITQPVLVVNGSNDIVVATVNSYILQQKLPNARLILFPDSNHGSHFQYHDIFVRETKAFLDRD
jgi:pimeloyl-ACP methyl ester carboxylesterase